MANSKVKMPEDIKTDCHLAIHTAATAAAGAGALPIPMSDAVPITAAQIAMVVALGKVFGVTLSQSIAKSLLGVSVTVSAGRTICANLIKCIPGAGSIVGGAIGASTAFALTEALGWTIADDFYRLSIGQEPEDLVQGVSDLKDAFSKQGTFSDMRYKSN